MQGERRKMQNAARVRQWRSRRGRRCLRRLDSGQEVSAANTAQRGGEGVRGCRAGRPASRQHHRRERDHGRRQACGRRRRGAAVETLTSNAIFHVAGRAPRERMLPRDHLVQRHAQRPDVVAFIGRAAGQHLGRQIARPCRPGSVARRRPTGEPDRSRGASATRRPRTRRCSA